MDNELIHLSQIHKTFVQGAIETAVLQQINLQLHDGECVAITGASGSGKSTLLSIIGLLDDASSGEYRLRGQAVATLNRQQKGQLRNRHIGWIFQNFNLINELTAIENVILPLRFDATVKSSEYHQRASAVLERVGLGHKLHAKPTELSGGQQQRVAIARALVNQPSLLLADEPTGNLDSSTGQSIVELLLQLARDGATVVMVTHDPHVAAQCDRIIQLVDGRIHHAN
jgi:putative ABC transport system ATP-binding protein